MATPQHLQRSTPQYTLEPLPEEYPAPPAGSQSQSVAIHTPQREQVLIDPRLLDQTLPGAKAIAAALGWINSIATTVLSAADLQHFVTDKQSNWIAIVAGFAVAAFLTFGQIYTSGRNRKAYAVFLFPDALMTSLQWGKWLLLPLFLKLIPIWWLAVVVAAIIGGVIGIVSARTPERLAFGSKK